jgi:undecaprenyl-diphosphatase
MNSRLIRVTACLLIAGIAGSRVYLGVHYPSDVIGGILGGTAWVGGALGWLRPRMAPS